MRVAVTGAAGLLGAAVRRRLRADGHDVLAMSSSLPASAGDGVVRWEATQDWRHTAKALADVDLIIHAAAYIPRDHGDVTSAQRCIEVNAFGTLNLLRAAREANVGRFAYVSSANVLIPCGELVREDDPVGSADAPFYLGSKVLGEIYVRGAMARGMDGLIVRPSSIYGPGMTAGALWTFATRLRSGLPIRLHDAGRYRADFIWRDDVVAVLSQVTAGGHRGVVNVGSGQATSLIEAAQLISTLLNADPRLIDVAPQEGASTRHGYAAVDISRAREWFGFSPTALNVGLKTWIDAGES